MSRAGQVWQVRHAGELLAELTVTEGGFPWVTASVQALEAFLPWRAAFDEERRLLDGLDDHVEQWEDAYRRIDEHLTLHDPTGERVPEYLLHIEADTAWWRWSHEPFPPEGR